MSILFIVLIVLLILALVGAFPGVQRYGYVGASPIVVIIVVILILWLVGLR